MPFLERYVRIMGHGELAYSASAAQMPDRKCQGVRFRGPLANTGNVYVGLSVLTVPGGTTNATAGLEIGPGEYSPHIALYNLNELYYIMNTVGDELLYFLY